ncbi:hypothetical protein DCAR_0831610 [Daucus carota subsp. sativus]|uniref:Uncharacterized protein n=1 Tax=Daucus carota subsp. sativus TaxID=79200 RepID=A0A175YNN8_DAUCS|nr:PREDICTED: uncharacterized protein LOC108197717 [Daucus carota subsp. sativus]WOH12111.1 hypothetical protein DCAR_0831610 [Daucus carota subsp. sativus]
MEGVGARLGRSSTRYGGPATVFTGPVRKWKKKWVHIAPSNAASSNPRHSHSFTNANANGVTHLKLFKWTPLLNANAPDPDQTDDDEPPRRKFKYVPIALLEEQKDEASEQVEDEAAEQVEDEAKPSETNIVATDLNSKADDVDEKPDINNVPMEENETPENPLGRQDLNESTVDLGINLNSRDGENDSDSMNDQIKDGEPETLDSVKA